jgi:glyoxylase-like metal-dependent hydrolase (beta-lactamase superfamily II)
LPSAEEPITIRQIEKGVFLLTEQTSGSKANAVVFNSNGVSLMIDSFGSPSIAAAAMLLLRKNGIDLPGYLVYTHWHADHTCGSSALPPCTTIAREETTRMLRNFVSRDMQQLKVPPQVIPPTVLLYVKRTAEFLLPVI